MATNEAKVEFFKTRPEHKKQVGGATFVCEHLANRLNSNEPLIECQITAADIPGEFAAICISCAEYIWASLPKQ